MIPNIPDRFLLRIEQGMLLQVVKSWRMHWIKYPLGSTVPVSDAARRGGDVMDIIFPQRREDIRPVRIGSMEKLVDSWLE
jgi:hypothetical protein